MKKNGKILNTNDPGVGRNVEANTHLLDQPSLYVPTEWGGEVSKQELHSSPR